MKFLIALLFLTSCATQPKRPDSVFSCAIFGSHRAYVNLAIKSPFMELAEEEAEKVRLRLVAKKIVPENTAVMCFKDEKLKK
jgi:hypothetical protein